MRRCDVLLGLPAGWQALLRRPALLDRPTVSLTFFPAHLPGRTQQPSCCRWPQILQCIVLPTHACRQADAPDLDQTPQALHRHPRHGGVPAGALGCPTAWLQACEPVQSNWRAAGGSVACHSGLCLQRLFFLPTAHQHSCLPARLPPSLLASHCRQTHSW